MSLSSWFWADSSAYDTPSIPTAPHPLPSDKNARPPPECPMHNVAGADTTPSPLQQRISSAISQQKASSRPAANTMSSQETSSCPVKSPSQAERYPKSPDTPIESPSQSQAHSSSWSSTLNPLNYMPTFKNERPTNSTQSISLPLDRETSTIPRADTEGNWEYPSPQQMYNAMLRKGHTDTPAEDVESMVAVHNFLNEGAWQEIIQWERLFAPGLSHGLEACKRGEEGIAMDAARRTYLEDLAAQRRQQSGYPSTQNTNKATSSQSTEFNPQPKLLRFQGRPNEPTPKARMLSYAAKLFPQSFTSDPPFDRHDWYVARQLPNGSVKEVRYVIDYYGGGLQATGEPVFYLDIRPALDTPTACAERIVRWGSDAWWRAKGGDVREKAQAAAANTKARMG